MCSVLIELFAFVTFFGVNYQISPEMAIRYSTSLAYTSLDNNADGNSARSF
eukprot:c33670_g1_i1 orf=48-200(+)